MSKTFKDRKPSPEEKQAFASECGHYKENKAKRSRLRELVDEECEEELKWLKA